MKSPPIVMVFAGNDPTGGAGLCADTQALASHGCHIAPIVTSITVQNTSRILNNMSLSGEQITAQAEAVLDDMPIAAFKIGLLTHTTMVEAIQSILLKYSHLPVILDPILASGSGQNLVSGTVRKAIIKRLLPMTYVLTPNTFESQILTGLSLPDIAALHLLNYGCQFVCITGTHANTPEVKNILYSQGKQLKTWTYRRLPYSYHGSGCTFAASVAGLLAQGKSILDAVEQAQNYTWESLKNGYQPAQAQYFPNRLGNFY
ncbi:MAG: hydroxymethylpyrimidine/phosphomethylpyrimidine kinase [Thiomargarita sp.]|nr:hydroxymethylpyrimidine/phosphomethylpyrimidine kinase [Thiomargarita sp.]